MSDKKKKVTAVAAIATAAALLLGGTYAWQSISQTALNETDEYINPGGRLHDDFDGSNKDVYVENFADNRIFARVRLDEYFEITMNKNTPAETTEVITTGATKGDTDTYLTHYFDQENLTDTYWDWATGGSTTYMPTFNKNKDSLQADINGTYDMNFDDYVDYTHTTELTDNAVYDADSNSVEDENVKTVEETHYATTTENGTLISMADWLALYENGEEIDYYWVYDTDGWVYWSSPIESGEATGLLLDGISLKDKMDDSYYYAINVTAQFVTYNDVGKNDNTGFYDTTAGSAPSSDAETLLEIIGIDFPYDGGGDEGGEDIEVEFFSLQQRDSVGTYPVTVYSYSDSVNYIRNLENHTQKIFDITLCDGVTLNDVTFEREITGTSFDADTQTVTLSDGDGQSFTVSITYDGTEYEYQFVPIFNTIIIEKGATAETSVYNTTGGLYELLPENFDADATISYEIGGTANRSSIDYMNSTYYLSVSHYESSESYTITATDTNGNSGTVKIVLVDNSPYDGVLFYYSPKTADAAYYFGEGQDYTFEIGQTYELTSSMSNNCDATLTWRLIDSSGNYVETPDKIGFVTDGGEALSNSDTSKSGDATIFLKCTDSLTADDHYTLEATSDMDIYYNETTTVRRYTFEIYFQNLE